MLNWIRNWFKKPEPIDHEKVAFTEHLDAFMDTERFKRDVLFLKSVSTKDMEDLRFGLCVCMNGLANLAFKRYANRDYKYFSGDHVYPIEGGIHAYHDFSQLLMKPAEEIEYYKKRVELANHWLKVIEQYQNEKKAYTGIILSRGIN